MYEMGLQARGEYEEFLMCLATHTVVETSAV